MIHHLPPALLLSISERVIVPLKDAMRITAYSEGERNSEFHVRKKIKGSKKEIVFRSYSFKLRGTLKHEMYIKPLNPALIKSILGKDYAYHLIMKPNLPINLDDDSKNKRSIDLVICFRRAQL
ncbi:MAG: hypothetical protein H0W61_11360 [Bacteroidetes bacterium]|nr:hypothetical protein [Bacteroidota bacterium]